jgi:uncharacterized protein YbcC (UPF0753/DUF2309 family)
MPRSAEGFYDTVRSLYGRDGIHRLLPEERYLRGLTAEFRSQRLSRLTSIDAIISILSRLGMTEAEWESVIEAELLALPGWAGLFHQLELDPGLAPHAPWQSTLVDFLAVRLTLTLIACDNIRQVSGQNGSAGIEWRQPAKEELATNSEHLAQVVQLYDAAQLLGLSAGQINSLSESEFKGLLTEIDLFDELERRRILHLAYERRHEFDILAPLKTFRETIDPERRHGMIHPKAQIFFCIDEREESIRRAIEEQEPGVETFGAAGFFGVAVNYRGLDDPEGVSLCPVVIKPQHAVIELPVRSDERMQQKRQQRRRLLASLLHASFISSRTLFRGWIGDDRIRAAVTLSLLGRTLAPRQIGRLYRWLEDRFLPTPSTELTIMRAEESGEELTDQLLTGFSINEKADRVAAVLRPVGLIRDFSRLVVILGHGSTCLNDPHESAYRCGACGGRRGDQMRGSSRQWPTTHWYGLASLRWGFTFRMKHGFWAETTIPPVTTSPSLMRMPSRHHILDHPRFVRRVLDAARAANALERSRRFESAWANKTPESALLHVQERAEHLAEPRPSAATQPMRSPLLDDAPSLVDSFSTDGPLGFS